MDVTSAHISIACERIYKERLFPDVTFKTGQDSTLAHKCILTALSPVFLSMFTSGFQEEQTSTVEINDMSTEQLRAFLEFLYTGRLEMQMVVEHGLQVSRACHKYCVPFVLTDASVSALCDTINMENCLALLEHAYLYNEEKLAIKCRAFIQDNVSEFIEHNGEELANRNPGLLLELVKIKLPPVGFREIRVWFRRYNTEKESLYHVLLPVESTVSALITEVNKLRNKTGISLRIFEVSGHKIGRVFRKKDSISGINQDEDEDSLRAEETSIEDKSAAGKYMLHVHHFRTGKWKYEAFGEPFIMHVDNQETIKRVKQRIKVRLGVSNEAFDSWRFARFKVVPGLGEYVPPTYLEDNMRVSSAVDGASSSKRAAMMPLGIHHTLD